MKLFYFLSSILLLISCSYSQQFYSLDGIENSNGETILLYHYGSADNPAYTPVYKFDVSSGSAEQIIDAFFVNGSYTKNVEDFEYFPNDTLNFVNCGYGDNA